MNNTSISQQTKENTAQSIGGIQLKDLYNELERKDLVIQNLQKQLSSTQSQTDLLMTTKKEENNLRETNLRTQICQRDQIIKEKDSKISLLEKDLQLSEKKQLEMDGEVSNLNQEVNEMNIKIKNYQLQLNAKEEENKNLKIEYENKITLLQKEKKTIEAKIAQLVEIIKQYSKELSDLSIHIESIEAEKASLHSLNKKLTEKNEESTKLIKQYKNEIESIHNLYQDNKNLYQSLSTIQNELNTERNFNQSFKKEKDQYEQKIVELTSKLNQYSTLQKSYEEVENELVYLKSNYTQMEINNNVNSKRANECENELNSIYVNLNQLISSLVEWIETYFGVYYDYEITDIPSNFKISKNVKINLLYDCLVKKRKKINDDLERYENAIKSDGQQAKELLGKIDSLQKDNDLLKNEVIKVKNELVKADTEIEKNKRVIEEKDTNYNELNALVDKINQKYKEDMNEIQTVLSEGIKKMHTYENLGALCEGLKEKEVNPAVKICSLFDLTDKLIREYQNGMKIKEENKKLQEVLGEVQTELNKSKIDHQEKIKQVEAFQKAEHEKEMKEMDQKLNKAWQKKYEEMSKANEGLSTESQNLKGSLKLLEKKLNNLQTEMDLKDMQIKSQEEIIKRRNKKQNESVEDSIVKNLETDKEKLINDNILLINDNRYLKEQLDKMSCQLRGIIMKK